MIKNKFIRENLKYWMMKFIHCKDIENKIWAGSLLTHVVYQRVKDIFQHKHWPGQDQYTSWGLKRCPNEAKLNLCVLG